MNTPSLFARVECPVGTPVTWLSPVTKAPLFGIVVGTISEHYPSIRHVRCDDGHVAAVHIENLSVGSPLVDVVDFASADSADEGTIRDRSVPLADCFPEPDDYIAALANVLGRDGEHWTGGGAAPLVCVQIARSVVA
jgi:hypothetical protein